MNAPLAVHARLDRTNVPASDRAEAFVAIDVEAEETTLRDRPPFDVVFVLDTSASMKGPPLEHVVGSVKRLASMLMPRDRFGVVTFANEARVVMPSSRASSDSFDALEEALASLVASGQTNMAAGLEVARTMGVEGEARRMMFLLSDGVPNIGLCTPMTLAEVVRPWRDKGTLWSLGYGPHHQEDVLAAASDAGGGRYQYIPQSEVCEFAFAKALGAQADIVGEAVELRLMPREGIEIRRVLGKYEQRFGAGGLVLRLPDIFLQTKRRIVVEIGLGPWSKSSVYPGLDVILTCRIAGSDHRFTVRKCVDIQVADTLPTVHPEARASVLLARCDEARKESRILADRGDYEAAAKVLTGMLEIIGRERWFDPAKHLELADACEVLRDESNALANRPTMDLYRQFRRSQLSIELSGESFSVSDHRMENEYGQRLVHAVAGEYPAARLEQLGGDEDGRVVVLRAEQSIGRGRNCDIIVHNETVSRAHAQVVAQNGRFFVVDLGSSAGTLVNGRATTSHELHSGDEIRVGQITFRYVERDADAEDRMCAITTSGDVFVLEKDRLFVIGRSRACSLVIRDMGIAQRHAYVEWRDGAWWIGAYDSPAGIRRRGQPVTNARLRHGDVIQFGVVPLRFEVRRPPTSSPE